MELGRMQKKRACLKETGREFLIYQQAVYLKGLGHAILGNFSTDRMVIELTKISK